MHEKEVTHFCRQHNTTTNHEAYICHYFVIPLWIVRRHGPGLLQRDQGTPSSSSSSNRRSEFCVWSCIRFFFFLVVSVIVVKHTTTTQKQKHLYKPVVLSYVCSISFSHRASCHRCRHRFGHFIASTSSLNPLLCPFIITMVIIIADPWRCCSQQHQIAVASHVHRCRWTSRFVRLVECWWCFDDDQVVEPTHPSIVRTVPHLLLWMSSCSLCSRSILTTKVQYDFFFFFFFFSFIQLWFVLGSWSVEFVRRPDQDRP